MSSHGGSSRGDEKPPVGGELIIPVAGILFAIYYFTTIIDAPWTAQVNAFFIGTVLIVLSLLFIVLRLRKLLDGSAVLGFHRLIEPVSILPKRIVLLILTIGYVAVISWAGFTITSFVFLFLAISALGGRRYGLNLMNAAAFSIGGWLLFDVAFQAQLPAGPFEALMKGFM